MKNIEKKYYATIDTGENTMEKYYKVYGAYGHRQKESFNKSYSFKTWDGVQIDIINADMTKTNEYTIVRIVARTAAECDYNLNAQVSDGVFENCRVGMITECKEHHTSYFRGYVSRKSNGIYSDYSGRFGNGFTIKTPNYKSTTYSFITYFIED